MNTTDLQKDRRLLAGIQLIWRRASSICWITPLLRRP